MDLQLDSRPASASASPKHAKNPVVRGARACTVCRAAKMKCVGAEDGQQPCQRCKRSNTECVFEKHRRGRKPGSKLSEASKMLRRLEKGLSNAKLKSQAIDSRNGIVGEAPVRSPYANGQTNGHVFHQSHSGNNSVVDEDENDSEPKEEGMYPAKLIRKERQHNSFFDTVLKPSSGARSPNEHYQSVSPTIPDTSAYTSAASTPQWYLPTFGGLEDPVQKGLMDESTAENYIDLVLIRLNPFINLFDPELHSINYIRRCPFLFTTLLMAGTKFFDHRLYPKCRELAELHAVKAFAEQKKSVEVVQAFMCLTYWRELDDTRTWTYIGYACRMAVELGLNRYTPSPLESETPLQRLERRNRERTYLVLFVHDRSLSMQTGRLYMLPEDDIVTESLNWHEQVPPGGSIRPEDVVLTAFVALRLIATETTRMFELQKGPFINGQPDNYDFLLNATNTKLSNWSVHWSMQMKRANGTTFHHSFLEFFQLYVGLFLNSFGIHAYMSNVAGPSPSLQALGTCYRNASRCLEIVVKDFARVQMLYSQESVTTMTAYCAVMLLRLLNKQKLSTDEGSSPANVLDLIRSCADAYKEAGAMMPQSSSCAPHARFLRTLVEREEARPRSAVRRVDPIDPSLAKYSPYQPMQPSTPEAPMHVQAPSSNSFAYHQPYPNSPPGILSGGQNGKAGAMDVYQDPSSFAHSPADADYYNNMCRELGVTQGVDIIQASPSNFYHQRMPNSHYAMMGHT